VEQFAILLALKVLMAIVPCAGATIPYYGNLPKKNRVT
jgi:hypothetical protein